MVSTGSYPHSLTHVFGGIVVSQVKYTFGLLGLRTGVPLPACTCTLATAAPGWTGTWMCCVSILHIILKTYIPCIEDWKLKTVNLTTENVYDQNICYSSEDLTLNHSKPMFMDIIKASKRFFFVCVLFGRVFKVFFTYMSDCKLSEQTTQKPPGTCTSQGMGVVLL